MKEQASFCRSNTNEQAEAIGLELDNRLAVHVIVIITYHLRDYGLGWIRQFVRHWLVRAKLAVNKDMQRSTVTLGRWASRQPIKHKQNKLLAKKKEQKKSGEMGPSIVPEPEPEDGVE